jgi:chromosomal replication initiation ATPase DnaA
MTQLPFLLDFPPAYGEEDFLTGSANEGARAWIDVWPNWPDRLLVLCGADGAGKSHLAAIWARRSGARRLDRTILSHIPARELATPGGALLLDPVPEPLQEQALFHLINLVREQQGWLVMTAREPPVRWPVKLPDLASRLAALPVVEIGEPDDTLLAALLIKLLSDRQMTVDPALPEYLLKRMERSYASARDLVARLDAAALAERRPISLMLARQVLEQGN